MFTGHESERTCLRETGKVSFPEISGQWTISWHIALQDRHTEAQATTCFLAGQLLSLSSSLLITSKSSSGGRLAHLLVWTIKGERSREDEYSRNEEPWDFPLWWSLKSKLLLDKLPSPSLKSWTMLLNDISLSLQTRTVQIEIRESSGCYIRKQILANLSHLSLIRNKNKKKSKRAKRERRLATALGKKKIYRMPNKETRPHTQLLIKPWTFFLYDKIIVNQRESDINSPNAISRSHKTDSYVPYKFNLETIQKLIWFTSYKVKILVNFQMKLLQEPVI